MRILYSFPFEKLNTFIPYYISEKNESLIHPTNVESVNTKKTNIGNISKNNEFARSLKPKLTKLSETTKFDCSKDQDTNITLESSYIGHF